MNRKILLISFLFLCTSVLAQEQRFLNKFDSSRSSERESAAQLVFNEIESSVSSGKVEQLSRFFGSQTYFSLSNGISGYYSANQAYYVLEEFFKIYQPTSFRLKNLVVRGESPYATGVYNYEFKGKRDSAQVYISLKSSGGNWKITQITIN